MGLKIESEVDVWGKVRAKHAKMRRISQVNYPNVCLPWTEFLIERSYISTYEKRKSKIDKEE